MTKRPANGACDFFLERVEVDDKILAASRTRGESHGEEIAGPPTLYREGESHALADVDRCPACPRPGSIPRPAARALGVQSSPDGRAEAPCRADCRETARLHGPARGHDG